MLKGPGKVGAIRVGSGCKDDVGATGRFVELDFGHDGFSSLTWFSVCSCSVSALSARCGHTWDAPAKGYTTTSFNAKSISHYF